MPTRSAGVGATFGISRRDPYPPGDLRSREALHARDAALAGTESPEPQLPLGSLPPALPLRLPGHQHETISLLTVSLVCQLARVQLQLDTFPLVGFAVRPMVSMHCAMSASTFSIPLHKRKLRAY